MFLYKRKKNRKKANKKINETFKLIKQQFFITNCITTFKSPTKTFI